MADNTPQPGNTVVPSARAERLRIGRSDVNGITLYALMAGTVSILLILIVWAA